MFDRSGVAEVFGDEWPRLIATLVADLGDLGLAEEAAQDAFVEAAARWENSGRPDKPGAWLLTTARRKAIDRIRRDRRFAQRRDILERLERDLDERTSHDLIDDQLALICGCCHPALGTEAQVALTLRLVAGLSTAQIARAFLVSEPTMTRRLTRSKTKIRAANIPFHPIDRTVLNDRVGLVCGVIYSVFTEGHSSATASTLIRGDLCDEAIWLAQLVARLVPNDPEVLGLNALLLLTDARRESRRAADGSAIVLADQDRSHWNEEKIASGLDYLSRAHALRHGGTYQFQAAIAALHSTAASFDATDWNAVVAIYDVLLTIDPTSIVALNRALAVAHLDGPATALAAIEAIELADDLTGDLAEFPYFHSARGELLAQLNRLEEAARAFDLAVECCTNASERDRLHARKATIFRNDR